MSERSEGHQIVERHRGLVGRTALVSALTLLSRLLGFVREIVMAAVFGDSSAVSDAFFTAWRVPNLFRRLFGEGALSTSLQAGITEADAEGGDEAGRSLFLRTVLLMVGVLLVVSSLSMLAVFHMPDRMPGLGWAWLGADPEPVRDLAVRLMPYVVLVCVAALCGGALYVRGQFGFVQLQRRGREPAGDVPRQLLLEIPVSCQIQGYRRGPYPRPPLPSGGPRSS